MIRFHVDWLPDAIDDLAEIWMRAANRASVNFASAMIDQRLAESPSEWGKEVREELYEFNAPPLRVLFTIDDANHVVEIFRAFLSSS
ncbi:MAG TPA: type II toxin-antitoxin system RelE/ParE family toxin [Pirellulales bacterium]|nr:type II toxin-antitoxin system RelE/ParE family toxin [Pirellulales bacterium]